jgi:hypothetical protein
MIDTFLEQLSIPKSCELNKPVYKKDFLENGLLDATDKKALKEDVDKIRWLYTLKPSTINISAYSDDEKDYPEVAILHVELLLTGRAKRIASFMQRSIPYPLVLFFSFENTLCVSLAEKRINQSDKEKWVVEDSYDTDWINLEQPTTQQADFLEDCNINNFLFSNFHAFYKSILYRVIALACSAYTGVYELNKPEVSDRAEDKRNSNRVAYLRELENLNSDKAEIANRLKKENQMGKQVELNTKIKQINDQIDQIKENI